MCSGAIISPVHRGTHDINRVFSGLALRRSRFTDTHDLQPVGTTKTLVSCHRGMTGRRPLRHLAEADTVETRGDPASTTKSPGPIGMVNDSFAAVLTTHLRRGMFQRRSAGCP